MARVLTYPQLESLWEQAGGGKHVAPVMAAIALAESGGRVNAKHHDANGSTDYGLWQINSVHGYNAHKLTTDPLYNAHAAVAVYHSQGLGAWTTYQTGAYKKYLSGANVTGGGSISGTSGWVLPFNTKDTKFTHADEGLDYTSQSPYVAVAPGKIVRIDSKFTKSSGGQPESAVYERLDTPVTVNGRTYHAVYYSETQPLVSVGQHVQGGQTVIGPGNAELGFAKKLGKGNDSWVPAAYGKYDGTHQTQASKDFQQVLTGVFSGNNQGAGHNQPGDPFAGGFGGIAGSIAGAGQAIASPFESIAGFFESLTKVSTWIRVGEVLGGGILILLGLYLLTRQIGLGGFDVPVPQKAKDSADDAAGTVTPTPNAPRPTRVTNQYYVDTPSGQTRRTRELARRGRERESDEVPF